MKTSPAPCSTVPHGSQWASARPLNPAPTISPPDPHPASHTELRDPRLKCLCMQSLAPLGPPVASTPSRETCEDQEVRGRSRAGWPGVAGGGRWGWWELEEW